MGRHGTPLALAWNANLFLDRVEAWLAEHAPQAGVSLLGPTLLRLLLFADDMSFWLRGLPSCRPCLMPCKANGLRVNVGKSEIVASLRLWQV
jgi:hypothetical protein